MNSELIALPESIVLAQKIAKHYEKKLLVPEIKQFADGEMEVIFPPHHFDGKKVVIIHAPFGSVNDALVHFTLLCHAARISGAQELIAVIPYLWYMRQDKSNIKGIPGGWQAIVQLLESTGISRIITIELHSPLCVDVFTRPIDNINPNEYIAQHIARTIPEYKQCCFIAPDAGAFERVEEIGKVFNAPVMTFKKERFDIDKTKIVAVSGSCGYDTAIIIDDILSTGGTAINACNKLQEMGVKKIYGYFVHPVLPGNAMQRIEKSDFSKVYVSNTIPHEMHKESKIAVFDISAVLVKKIKTVL